MSNIDLAPHLVHGEDGRGQEQEARGELVVETIGKIVDLSGLCQKRDKSSIVKSLNIRSLRSEKNAA